MAAPHRASALWALAVCIHLAHDAMPVQCNTLGQVMCLTSAPFMGKMKGCGGVRRDDGYLCWGRTGTASEQAAGSTGAVSHAARRDTHMPGMHLPPAMPFSAT